VVCTIAKSPSSAKRLTVVSDRQGWKYKNKIKRMVIK